MAEGPVDEPRQRQSPGPKRHVSKRERQRALARRQRLRKMLMFGAAAAAVVAVVAIFPPGAPPQGSLDVALSQHVHIDLFINGTQVTIPAHIGVNQSLWRDHKLDTYSSNQTEAAVHTHNQTGSVHIALRTWHACTLGDFFKIWGVPFDSGHLIGFVGPVAMTVSGARSDAFGGLVLQEGQQIVIRGG